MRKFLIVGCGGSGGATLSYMMDQLQSDLALYGVDRIPAGWQFVHIDVPVGSTSEADGLDSVEGLGGRYFGSGAVGINYKTLDDGVSQRLEQTQALDSIATWAPRDPERVGVALAEGAGQYRAVGRMVALSKPRQITEVLESAWKSLGESDSEMASLNVPGLGKFVPGQAPVVLLVSSMAGGAGASMVLDVARLLTTLSGLDPSLLGVFMVSADIFNQLPVSARSGVRANSLAMLGEIVATQTGAAREHDVATLMGVGVSDGVGPLIPFQRVFPVGGSVGSSTPPTPFGDGSTQGVYRGLGRGLAALIRSESANLQFVRYDLANTGGLPTDRRYLGWGADVDVDKLLWGSFGFASLSMGRERYREYSAQRLSRTAVDRLLTGHQQEGNTVSSGQEVGRLVDAQWSRVAAALALPSNETAALTPQEIFTWFTEVAFPRDSVSVIANGLVDANVAQNIPLPGVTPAGQWIDTLHQKLKSTRAGGIRGITDASEQWAYAWQQGFAERLVAVIEEAVSTFGLPYATALLIRLESHIGNYVVGGLRGLSQRGRADIATIDPAFAGKVSSMKVIANAQEVVSQLVAGFRGAYRDALYGQSAALAEQVLADSVAGLISPLKDAMALAQAALENAQSTKPTSVGLARMETDLYRAWPSDADAAVPTRFDVADNEVLLTPSSDFAARYEGDVRASLGEDVAVGDYVLARTKVIAQIVEGNWTTVGAQQAPKGLISVDSPWRSGAFSANPLTGAVEIAVRGRFTIHVGPAELLRRARQYVGRPGESFDNFCKVSLRHYVLGEGDGASELQIKARQSEIAVKFRDALTLARPLVGVNATAVSKLHGREMEYRYKFSELPFQGVPQVSDVLTQTLVQDTAVDQASSDNLAAALTANDAVTRIDIFGSYPNYSPIAFDSVLDPVTKEWAALSALGRPDWWKWRRARPLTASLPMGNDERQAMVAGWFVGLMTGDIVLPDEPYTSAVRIWDTGSGGWANFPNPLLTPHSSFKASYDWLPAVLESGLIAVAKAHEAPVFESLVPYMALRGLYDLGIAEPTSNLEDKSVERNVGNWVAGGVGASGAASKIAGVSPADGPAERAEAAKAWLTSINTLAGAEYMRPGQDGAPGGGRFSVISSRAVASATPIFRDLAEDVYEATAHLIAILEKVKDRPFKAAPTGATAVTATPYVDPAKIEIPEGGTF